LLLVLWCQLLLGGWCCRGPLHHALLLMWRLLWRLLLGVVLRRGWPGRLGLLLVLLGRLLLLRVLLRMLGLWLVLLRRVLVLHLLRRRLVSVLLLLRHPLRAVRVPARVRLHHLWLLPRHHPRADHLLVVVLLLLLLHLDGAMRVRLRVRRLLLQHGRRLLLVVLVVIRRQDRARVHPALCIDGCVSVYWLGSVALPSSRRHRYWLLPCVARLALLRSMCVREEPAAGNPIDVRVCSSSHTDGRAPRFFDRSLDARTLGGGRGLDLASPGVWAAHQRSSSLR